MKSFFTPLASVAAVTGLIVSAGLSADAEIPAEYAFVKDLFPTTEVTAVKESPLPGFIEMKVGSDIFYISKDEKYLIQGDIYDIETQVNLTENSKADTRKAYAQRFDDDHSIVFPAKNPVAEVVVFTDIDCGYCRKLHREIAGYNENGISIRYVFFPRSGPGSAGWLKAEQVWCAESRTAAMTSAKNNEPFTSGDCDASVIEEHFAVVNELGLTGTPALLTTEGVLIVGYRSPDELLKILDLET